MYLKHDKNTVLHIGLRLLCSKGYNDLGVDEICKVTGMTKGAFYNAFKSKELFLSEAIALYQENNLKRIHSQLQKKGSHNAYERLLRFYIDMLKAQPANGYTGCFINNIMSELGMQSHFIAKQSSDAYHRFIDAILPTVREAQQEGSLQDHISARKITELLHSTFYGVLTIAKSTQDHKQGIHILKILFHNLKKESHDENHHDQKRD